MYDCGRVILDLDLQNKRFTWVTRQSCIDSLAHGNPSLWIDSCLLAGSTLLPTLPQIDGDASGPKPPKIRAAADLLRRTSLNGNSLCMQYRDDLAMQELNYLDNFRKAFMSIQHHVVLTHDGEIVTLNKDSAPNDVHAFIGQRLPDEIYYYVSRGTIGTRILTWRTSGQVTEKPPADGGASITYETLVRDRIVPQRVKALALLSKSIHRFYQHQDVTLSLFFSTSEPRKLGVTAATDYKEAVSAWHVRKSDIADRSKATKAKDAALSFAVESLSSSEFAKSTVTPRSKGEYDPLMDVSEIKGNALWRYLQIQDYVTSAHELSHLGKALQTSYKVAESKGIAPEEYEEPILLGVELLRLQLLNRDNMFPVPPYHGQPYRGTETDQKNTLLVSRVACLGRLQHKAIGYTGPLSRHLLAYKSLVSVVRQSQRDLLDMSLCTMFLDGDIDRQIPEQDLKNCGLTDSLPFIRDVDCALGIAVKHYLDELSAQQDPTSPQSRQAIRDKGRSSWFPHALDFSASLEYAFNLWDALFAAVKELPSNVVTNATKEEWTSVDAWLNDRR
ncbi:hypothetical protein ANO11243_086520 [Dothideomycetidae sp. 11243]|nr:hypothetical protein ANO11243_086520 [fungal sp. No.11243]